MVSNLDLKPWQASGGSFTRNMVPGIGTSDPWLGLLGLPCLGLAWLASQPGSSLPTATTTAARRRRPPPLWMGVGRLVRHRASFRGHLMRTFQQLRGDLVQLRRDFVTSMVRLPRLRQNRHLFFRNRRFCREKKSRRPPRAGAPYL